MSRSTKLVLYGVVACLLTGGSGYVAGVQSNRWGITEDVSALGRKLEQMPMNVGNWECNKSEELEASNREMLQTFGSFVRTYKGPKPNDFLNVSVYGGPAGPISLHDPDVCYVSAGYSVDREATQERFKAGKDSTVELNTLVLKPKELGNPRLMVVWGWHDGSGWRVPDSSGMFSGPRWAFAGKPYLFKLQLAHPLSDLNPENDDAPHRFLNDFLPAVQQQVFGDGGGNSAADDA